MRRLLVVMTTAGALLFAVPGATQVPTGILSGRVTHDDSVLAGVTVEVRSAAMQGVRTATTSDSGDYIIRFLPPGNYAVQFVLAGFATLETSLKIAAAQTHVLDAELVAAAASCMRASCGTNCDPARSITSPTIAWASSAVCGRGKAAASGSCEAM